MQSKEGLGLIVMEGAKAFGNLVDRWLCRATDAPEGFTYRIEHEEPRFGNGEAKAALKESVRGMSLFILADVLNYSCTYDMRMHKGIPMSPDDHYMDLKRMISAIGGKANQINVIMPYLYGGRQHKRTSRESLDAALMLQELTSLGVRDIITFDAHDPRVENAVPVNGFDNLLPTYQILKTLFRPGVMRDIHNCVVVSPDEGAMTRNLVFASALGADVGMFYKQRDLREVHNGKNAIIKHEYMGVDLTGRDVLIVDDILDSGGSMLSVAKKVRERGARDVVIAVTFAWFSEGLDAFHEAYRQGYIHRMISTNLTYRPKELLEAEWYEDTDLSKYLSYVIYSIHNDMSIHKLLNPAEKIQAFLEERYFGK